MYSGGSSYPAWWASWTESTEVMTQFYTNAKVWLLHMHGVVQVNLFLPLCVLIFQISFSSYILDDLGLFNKLFIYLKCHFKKTLLPISHCYFSVIFITPWHF